MPKIKPFRAFIYNQDKIKDLSSVVCPPYDVISKVKQDYYHALNPYNFIRILLGKDITGEDKYIRAAKLFKDWIKDDILIQEQVPAVYFYSQEYSLKGQRKIRLGFIALLHLGDKKSSAFAHENTRLEPKEDRLRLLRRVKANLSPIFIVFTDKKRIIQRTFQQQIKDVKPSINIIDDDKTVHKLWRVDSPDILNKIQQDILKEDVFIADGHHRYEVASAYRDEMMKKPDKLTLDEPFNYLLTYFTSTNSQGLSILPIHRLVKLGKDFDMPSFKNKLLKNFDVEEIKDKIRFFFLMEKASCAGKEHVLGMYKDNRYYLLRLKNIKLLDKMIIDKPAQYRALDVSVLNYAVLKDVLDIALDDKERVYFYHDPDELISEVDKSSSCVAFFLNPVKIEQIISLALTGEKMPPKSTFFYPKVLSGLVINKLE